jgi:Tol biopolymer transport system component
MRFFCLFLVISQISNICTGQTTENIKNPSFNGLPITVNRTISFTTDEASYIDLDISPSGKTILFSFLGNIYTMPSSGGKAKQITRGLAVNRSPVWSPDGKLIAYESDATGFVKLHITDSANSNFKVLGEDNPYLNNLKPTWLPDSKSIVIGNNIYHLIGNKNILPDAIVNLLSFSEDGKFIYFFNRNSVDSLSVNRLDRRSGVKTEVFAFNKATRALNLRISPNAHWLSFIKASLAGALDSLQIIDLRSGEVKFLAHLNIKFAPQINDLRYTFSSDSKYLYIGYGGKIHRINVQNGNNEIIPFSADVNVDMGPLNHNSFRISLDSLDVKYVRSAQRSPDGKFLLFSALNKIYIKELPNGIPKPLVNQKVNQFQPTYSPDGKWIAYVSWKDSEGGHVWRVPSKGGKHIRITAVPGVYEHPSWSADGKMLIVAKGNNKLGVRDNPGIGQIQLINISDKSVRIIADSVPLFNDPVFSSDSQSVIFKPSQFGSKNKIWPKLISQNLGNNERKILAVGKNGRENIFPLRQILLSPDCKYFVYLYNENLFLVPKSNLGNPDLIFDDLMPPKLVRFARGAIDPRWEDGGKALSWIIGSEYVKVSVEKIIKAAEQVIPTRSIAGLSETNILDVDIAADEAISLQIKVPRLCNKGVIALKGARIITMHGDSIIERGTILIKDGRFISVGKSQEVSIPKRTKIFNLEGKTIIPGLIDMHSHMYEAVPPDVFLQQSWQRLLNLFYGVTTVRDPSGSFDTFGYSELIETGQMLGPRLFTVGFAVRPHYKLVSLHEAEVIVNNRVKMGAKAIKQYEQITRLQRQLLLLACNEVGVNMTNEVDQNPLYCLGMFKDGAYGVEHNPVWGDIYKDVITLVAKSGTFLTPTLQACYGRLEAKNYFRRRYGKTFLEKVAPIIRPDIRKQIKTQIEESKLDSGFLDQSKIDAKIKKAGGRIILGSHGEDQGVGVHYELWALQMGGLSNLEALQTATVTAAEGLGMEKDLGSIAVGKIADLIVLDKNPLEDIHNSVTVRYVMKSGVLYNCDELYKIVGLSTIK